MKDRDIVVAILAKDKSYCLEFYLHCLLKQTFDKRRTHLYIRTNDNTDNTEEILESFIKHHGYKYGSVHYDNSSVNPELKELGEHEWNYTRFEALARIRQDSIEYAIEKDCHYFVADCDNFITPNTIESLYADRHLGVVAPLLRKTWRDFYANYHSVADENGFIIEDEGYLPILYLKVRGKIAVDCVHCTYFISHSVLDECSYIDGTERYEYAIFSLTLRHKNIPQYLDNTKFFGFLCHLGDEGTRENFDSFVQENWAEEYNAMLEGRASDSAPR